MLAQNTLLLGNTSALSVQFEASIRTGVSEITDSMPTHAGLAESVCEALVPHIEEQNRLARQNFQKLIRDSGLDGMLRKPRTARQVSIIPPQFGQTVLTC